MDERTVVVVPPNLFDSLGDIVSLIETTGSGYTLVDVSANSLEDVATAAQLLNVDPKELMRPEPLVALSFRGANSVMAVNQVVESSSFEGIKCCSPTNNNETFANFFLKQQSSSVTTATFEDCTCCLIKPHAVKERSVGAILKDIISRGFIISALSMFNLERAAAAEFLEVYDGVVPEYPQMVDELCSCSLLALELRLRPTNLPTISPSCDGNESVVDKFREAAGPWDISMAKELQHDSIRALFGRDKVRNAIHCTDLPKDGPLEVEYFFKILSNANYIDGWK